MTEQLTLDALARSTDPESSHTARRSTNAAMQRRRILEHLELRPATADDLAPVLNKHRSIASTRLSVLAELGHAEKRGTADRVGDSGLSRSVDLWVITHEGRVWLRQVREQEAS